MSNAALTSVTKRCLRCHAVALCLALLALSLGGCNVIDIVTGQGARIADMTPGGNISSGGMDCWLTLEFKGPPEGTDARDVLVRFESVALKEPAKFEALYYERQEAPTMGVGPT